MSWWYDLLTAAIQATGITHFLVIKLMLKYFVSACAEYIFHIHLAYFSVVINDS